MRTSLCVTILLLAQCSVTRADRPCGPGVLNLLVPQEFMGADFRPACRKHDRCYASSTSRRVCDDRFERDMLRACRCSRFPLGCRMMAKMMGTTTKVWGGLYRARDVVSDGGRRVMNTGRSFRCWR